ncbi:glycoside hydrolase family 28 protein [Pedobacter sp. SD-b]|uniref:Glycoside hydrolase family 28 protein n=1 Tax=Pedobacter segetis TaxID=2793069 RepID=A0ABS1BMS0_9SPHI|nr:glycosyl hydrolase family 28-related protein [Pedobacter segetis]MBK0383606.1 glycoside hydrolase family 28 protein [Pedobacter segetis]
MMKKHTFFLLSVMIIYAFFNTLKAADFYNVKAYGAKGDGKTLDHTSINKAIDAAAKNGGGTVFLPAGTYLSGSIHMKSNINLFLDAGCIILGAPQNVGAYDPEEDVMGTQYQDGGHSYFHNSLIWGENLKNVTISGLGMINGGGLVTGSKGANEGKIGKATKAVVFKLCNNVVIKDITIFHGGHFAILVTGCNLVKLDKLIIDTNRDGIDIDCCTNTVVSNCMVNSPHDDAICPKSTFALGKKVITENLTITNCQVSGYKEGTLIDGTLIPNDEYRKGSTRVIRNGRIKLGTESNGGFRNVTISNCTFYYCYGLALEEVDGGIMENITIDNLAMYNINEYPIYITLGNRNRDPDTTAIPVGKNISISNVVVNTTDSLSGIHITGTPKHYLENIRINNVIFTNKGGGSKALGNIDLPELDKTYPEIANLKSATPSYGVYARHVKNLELNNIKVDYQNEDKRPPMACVDINGLEINNFKAEVANGVLPAIFTQVSDLSIYNSPVLNQK